MAGTVLFVHGTGVRDVSGYVKEISARVERVLGWKDAVVGVPWGKAVGPDPNLDVKLALPPEDAARAIAPPPLSPADEEAALWELLLVDPLAELSVLGQGAPAAPVLLDPTASPVDATFVSGVASLDVAAATLDAAGLTGVQLQEARKIVEVAEATRRAANVVGDARNARLVDAAARAIVAGMLAKHEQETVFPTAPAYHDAEARDALVAALAAQLEPAGERGFAQDVALKLLTKVLVANRARLMVPLAGFIRDIAFYIQHGEKVRSYLLPALYAAQGDPVILLAHSLGGVASVDLLSQPAVMKGPNPPKVDLLVTVGSQAPLLHQMDALAWLSPRTPHDPTPFVPWLNVYNRQDLLSFCATRVFDTRPISDEPMSTGVPFPASHSAYFARDELYELIRDRLAP